MYKDIRKKHKETLQNIRVSNLLIRAQTTEKRNQTSKTVTRGCIKFKEFLSAKGTKRQSAGQFQSRRLLFFPVEQRFKPRTCERQLNLSQKEYLQLEET